MSDPITVAQTLAGFVTSIPAAANVLYHLATKRATRTVDPLNPSTFEPRTQLTRQESEALAHLSRQIVAEYGKGLEQLADTEASDLFAALTDELRRMIRNSPDYDRARAKDRLSQLRRSQTGSKPSHVLSAATSRAKTRVFAVPHARNSGNFRSAAGGGAIGYSVSSQRSAPVRQAAKKTTARRKAARRRR